MRIVENTPARLRLRHRPWVLWGVMALLVGRAFWNAAFDDLFLEVGDNDVPLERGFGPYDRTAIATEISRWLDPPRPQSPPLMS